MAAAGAALQPKNHYDKHRIVCTCDDRRQAARLSGHTWNIINNKEDHEVYLQNARSRDHYVDERGNATSHWFQKKKRIDLDGDGIIDCVDSSNVAEVMVCPGTAGKESARLRARQAKQLLQAASPRDFAGYSARRGASAAPPTPRREADLERRVPFQQRLRDHPPARPAPRALDRQQFSARRGEARREQRPPAEHDLFRTVDQLRAESHADVVDANFAESLHSARRGSLAATGAASALAGASTSRSLHVGREDQPARPAEAMVRHSAQRLEASEAREISNWPFRQDKLQRGDAYHLRPVQQTGSSSVKYDIISNERRSYWY